MKLIVTFRNFVNVPKSVYSDRNTGKPSEESRFYSHMRQTNYIFSKPTPGPKISLLIMHWVPFTRGEISQVVKLTTHSIECQGSK